MARLRSLVHRDLLAIFDLRKHGEVVLGTDSSREFVRLAQIS